MKTRAYYHSLRFKITMGLLLAVIAVLAISSYLRYVSFRDLLMESLELSADNPEEAVEAQLTAYVRGRVILSVTSIVVILLMSDLLMGRVVVGRLRQFLGVVKRVGDGDLDAKVVTGGEDEIAELAEAFNRMTDELQRQTRKLSTLNTLASTVGQSLDLSEILRTALDEVLELMGLGAGWINVQDEHGEKIRIVASRGLPEEAALAHSHCLWNEDICTDVLESGRAQVFHNEEDLSFDKLNGVEPLRTGSFDKLNAVEPLNAVGPLRTGLCPAAGYLQEDGLIFHACVPLKSKDVALGVMSVAGVATSDLWMFTEDSLDTLTAIGRQIGIAIENASLYEELRQKEVLRRQLLEREITLREQERKRIARDLHDQTGQRLTSMIMTLSLLEEAVPAPEVRARVRDLRDTAAQVLKEVRDLALHLRPSLLDDLGLLAALRHYLKRYQNRYRLIVDFQPLGLDGKRLPPDVETTLFRITQQALTNVARHAQAHSVTVLLEHREPSVQLIVEDDGKGFDLAQVMDSRPHEGNLGLYCMRERVSLIGGTLTIESTPGRGTAVFVRIPVEGGKGDDGQDSSAGGG